MQGDAKFKRMIFSDILNETRYILYRFPKLQNIVSFSILYTDSNIYRVTSKSGPCLVCINGQLKRYTQYKIISE